MHFFCFLYKLLTTFVSLRQYLCIVIQKKQTPTANSKSGLTAKRSKLYQRSGLKKITTMQLEFNFNPAPDTKTMMKDFCENLYSIFITMQIISPACK